MTLTDGQTWSFYLPAEQGSYEERRVFKLDLFEQAEEACRRGPVAAISSMNRVVSGEALETARKEYRDRSRRANARRAIPDAWRALVENEELLTDMLAEAVESKVGVRPDDADVATFLRQLVLPDDPPGTIRSENHLRPSGSPSLDCPACHRFAVAGKTIVLKGEERRIPQRRRKRSYSYSKELGEGG